MQFEYYGWRERIWTCDTCSWSGPGSSCYIEPFEALFEVECGGCARKLGIILYPSREESEAAAALGVTEAVEELEAWRARDVFTQELDEARAALDHLPDLDGDELTFRFAAEGGNDWMSPEWLILLHGEVELYREPSGYEDWRSILHISEAVLRRYPGRVAWVDPAQAGAALLGDDLRAEGAIARFLRENGITPPDGGWASRGRTS